MRQNFFRFGKWLFLAGMIGLLSVAGCAKKGPIPTAHCNNLLSGCTVQMDDQSVIVRFSQPPVVLKPFTVQVTSRSAHRVEVSFIMVGMEMGSNKYRLEADSQGVWRSQVILPVCVTGRTDWVMTLEIDDASVKIPFVATK